MASALRRTNVPSVLESPSELSVALSYVHAIGYFVSPRASIHQARAAVH